ncbi:M56 family metallopeptidase [Pseudoalteromonas sp. G4]|uniref:M56 family metallopeptidase n=1 Tax=Pseudoalteromonas sp. G4 TaxID=2992761 RepID=UPI00237D705E|nr:TonB family protein [Pseudoalteromonas sp. G4]MDE3272552.1 TonB family protein [Pseudoalteromonas sp. G4]
MTNWLLEQLWPTSLAIICTLLCSKLLRNHLSARFQYTLWLLVPLVLLLNNLPVSSAMSFETELHRYVVSVTSQSKSLDVYGLLSMIWLTGFCLMSFLVFYEHLSISKKFNSGKQFSHKVNNRLPVYFSDAVNSPVLFGLIHQRLFIPLDFHKRYDSEQAKLIFQHEWVHFARKDNWSNALAITLLLIFWFNPLCWIGYSQYRKQQEVACDAAVLAHANRTQRIAYCRALLACVSDTKNTLSSYSYYTEKSTMKQRLNTIQKMPKGNILVNLLLCLVLFAGLSSIAFAKYGEGTKEYSKEEAQPIVRIEPIYPKEAADQSIEGSVVLGFTVTNNGQTDNIIVISAEPKGVFDKEAKKALRKWRYKPTGNTNKQYLVQLDFALSDDYKSKDLVERIKVSSH